MQYAVADFSIDYFLNFICSNFLYIFTKFQEYKKSTITYLVVVDKLSRRLNSSAVGFFVYSQAFHSFLSSVRYWIASAR